MTSAVTTDVFTENGFAVWRVAGPLGIVTYRLLGNHLRVEPIGSEPDAILTRFADQVQVFAAARADDEVFTLLIGWYHRLPEMFIPPWPDQPAAPPAPTTAEQWRDLTGDNLTAAVLAARWHVRWHDQADGWAVMPANHPPSSGVPTVASFPHLDVAAHITKLHNATIDGTTR